MSTPVGIADAFELGEPRGGLVHIRRGDADAWRLDTTRGSYFVKGYLPGAGEPLATAMDFERLALEAGVDMAEPIRPADPLVGWVTRVDGRLFRVYRWIEDTTSGQDISTWLGETMRHVHRLQPLGPVGLPEWWRPRSPTVREGWLAKARERGASWADLYDATVPHINAISTRISEVCDSAPDVVTTHGDFKTHNIVVSASGPVLVDWDSVRTDSAALEAGRTAYIFGAGEPERIRTILAAYVAAGGDLGWAGPDLFLSVTRHHLQVLADLIRVSLDEAPAARWMGQPIETAVTTILKDLTRTTNHLTSLGISS
ncbi:phosphotransferase [Kribbella sp. NPDC054772]